METEENCVMSKFVIRARMSDEMNGTCSTLVKDEKYVQNSKFGKPQGKTLGRQA
jgi:hypothetical protein